MIKLAAPWYLVLIPLPVIVTYWFYKCLPTMPEKNLMALKIPFYKRLQSIDIRLTNTTQKNNHLKWHKKMLLPYLIWFLFCLAISEPQWLGQPIAFPESGRDIMLALDLSGSMQMADMELHGSYFNRLSVVKIAARKFIEARTGDKLGLILFGTHAYLQTPLTFDQTTVLQMLDDATIGLAGSQTAIGDAIGLALKQLYNAKGNSKVIIVLTDGGNNAGMISPLYAATMAAKMGVKIYTIGIGSSRVVVPGVFGPQVIQPKGDLDEKLLQQIASITHGLFFKATSGTQLEEVYKQIDQLDPVISAKKIFRPIKPLYPWPLGLALLLSFFIVFRNVQFSSKKAKGEFG